MPSKGVDPNEFDELARLIESVPELPNAPLKHEGSSLGLYNTVKFGGPLCEALKAYQDTIYEHEKAFQRFKRTMDAAVRGGSPSSDNAAKEIATLSRAARRSVRRFREVEEIVRKAIQQPEEESSKLVSELGKKESSEFVDSTEALIRNLDTGLRLIDRDQSLRLSSGRINPEDLASTLKQSKELMPSELPELMTEHQFERDTSKFSHNFKKSDERKDLMRALRSVEDERNKYPSRPNLRGHDYLELTTDAFLKLHRLDKYVKALADVDGTLSKWKVDHGKSEAAQA